MQQLFFKGSRKAISRFRCRQLLRFEQSIPSKKGKIPSMNGVIEPIHANATFTRYRRGEKWAGILDVPYQAIPSLLALQEGEIIFPASAPPPSDRIVSRFLAKVAIEVIASRLLAAFGDAENLVDEQQLDLIRDHARRGMYPDWPFHIRRIYDGDKKWTERDGRELQTVHEYGLLMTPWRELFLVLAIFGVEFAINYGGAEIDGYRRWLRENNDRSPLYPSISLESLS